MNEQLASYASGEMGEDEARAFEERLFDDAALCDQAQELLSTLEALRALAAQGPMVPALPPGELERLEQRFAVRVARPVGGRIALHVGDEQFLVGRVPVDLSDAQRVDLRFCTPDGAPYFLAREVPFTSDEVAILCHAHVARARPRLTVQVLDERGAVRAEVTFENTQA